jgi:hypothetical protein
MWHVNPLLDNGLLKHVSKVMTEASIPRQHIQKHFHYNGYLKIVHTDRKTRSNDNRKNEEVYHYMECFVSSRRAAILGWKNWLHCHY